MYLTRTLIRICHLMILSSFICISGNDFMIIILNIYVTQSDKTSRIAVKYTYSFYGTYNLFWGCYSNSVSFIEYLRVFCICDKLCVKILFSEKILISFKSLKLAQNLHGNKTGFVSRSHIPSTISLLNKNLSIRIKVLLLLMIWI